MILHVSVTERVIGVPLYSVPSKLPISEARLTKVLARAATRVTDTMTVGEFKKIRAAQDEITTLMVTALVMYMKAAYSVDIPARILAWHSYNINCAGSWNRGGFAVIETAHDERAPSRTSNRWVVSKSALLKELRRPVERRFTDLEAKDDGRV